MGRGRRGHEGSRHILDVVNLRMPSVCACVRESGGDLPAGGRRGLVAGFGTVNTASLYLQCGACAFISRYQHKPIQETSLSERKSATPAGSQCQTTTTVTPVTHPDRFLRGRPQDPPFRFTTDSRDALVKVNYSTAGGRADPGEQTSPPLHRRRAAWVPSHPRGRAAEEGPAVAPPALSRFAVQLHRS